MFDFESKALECKLVIAQTETVPPPAHCVMNRVFPFFVLVQVDEGCYNVRLDGDWIAITAGKALFVPPHVRHDIKVETPSRYNWLHMCVNIADTMLDTFSLYDTPTVLQGDCIQVIRRCIFSLAHGNNADALINAVQKECDMQTVCLALLKQSTPNMLYNALLRRRSLPWEILYRISGSIDENIPISALAKEAHLSVSRFHELFKQTMGMPPREYITREKMRRACRMLAAENMTVSETAAALGYNDQSYFSKAFKKLYGIAPAKYKEKILSNKS